MASEDSPSELTSEAVDLNRALQELKAWRDERRRVLSQVEQYIQSALQSGKMTSRRSLDTKRSYLTNRMIATLQLECSLLKRSILFMQVRERQIHSRLTAISSLTEEEKKSA